MNRAFVLLFLCTYALIITPWTLAQDASPKEADVLELRLKPGSGDEALNDLLRFENIYMESVELQGSILQGAAYQLWVREFRDGKPVGAELLFDGTEAPLFNIKEENLSFRLLCKTQDETLRLQMSTPRFSSRRLKFQLKPSELDYVLKNFMGAQESLTVSAAKPIYLFAIIPPTIHANGSGSYCEVAQSGISPEEIGAHFNLPQYFLIEWKLVVGDK